MTRLVKEPNLPKAPLRGCIVSPEISKEIKEKLQSLEVELFFTSPCKNIQPALATHGDMLAHHAGGKHVFLEQSQIKLFEPLQNRGFTPIFIKKELQEKYPHDIALNCYCLKSKVFCNKNNASQELLEHYMQAGKDIFHVNQGYAKCSSLILSENAVISDDEGIAAACLNKGIDALLIQKGDIHLSSYPYGFIGGCGGLIDKGRLALFGDYNTHIDAEKIRAFASKHEVELLNLARGPLVDYGGLLPILEKDA